MKKSKNLTSIIIAIIVFVLVGAFVFFMVSRSTEENEFIIEGDTLIVEGMYGEEYSLQDASIELRDSVPDIGRKVNGSGLKNIKKGVFMVDDLGKCNLYIHNMESSCIVLITNDKTILINLFDEDDTIQLYNQLSNIIDA